MLCNLGNAPLQCTRDLQENLHCTRGLLHVHCNRCSQHHKCFTLLLQLHIVAQADAVQQLVLDTRDLAISSVEGSRQPLKHQLGERHSVRPTPAAGPLGLNIKGKLP